MAMLWCEQAEIMFKRQARVDPEENHPNFTQKPQNVLYSTNLILSFSFVIYMIIFIPVSMIRPSTYDR